MVRCIKCKHCYKWTDELGKVLLCNLDDFCVDDMDDLPCDFYVPLDADDSKRTSNEA